MKRHKPMGLVGGKCGGFKHKESRFAQLIEAGCGDGRNGEEEAEVGGAFVVEIAKKPCGNGGSGARGAWNEGKHLGPPNDLAIEETKVLQVLLAFTYNLCCQHDDCQHNKGNGYHIESSEGGVNLLFQQ